MYATEAEVRAAGAPSAATAAQIAVALAGAKERIDRYCSDTFESTALTVRALLSGGIAPLPLRVQTVSQVAYADVSGGGSVLAATSYAVRSSSTYGDTDAVQLLGYGLLSTAMLDITLEPVRSNVSELGERAVLVTGVFGWAITPDAVSDAAVQLALAGLPTSTGAEVNVEGDASLGIAPTVPALRVQGRTESTGNAVVDAALAPYVRRRLRIS